MQDAFHASLKRRLDEIISQRSGPVLSGMITTIEDYRFKVGYLTALSDVLTICDETEKKMYDQPLRGKS